MFKLLLCPWVFALLAGDAWAVTLVPASVEQFYVRPGEPAVLRWRVEGGDLSGPIRFTLRDYYNNPVYSGEAAVAGGTVSATIRPGRGFYDLQFAGSGQVFGVVALPPAAGKDDFFAIDAGLSWLAGDDGLRRGLVAVLARAGIAMARERQSWAQIHPAEGRRQWDPPQRYESLRKVYVREGVAVLEMFHDAPGWLGRVGVYPSDLVRTAEAWSEEARRWRRAWGALEVWNEPDISFGGFLPADQYVPLVEAVGWSLARTRVEFPLVGGVFAVYNPRYLDTAARNGLLDRVDVVSFHSYHRALEMESLVGDYRRWAAEHGHPSIPLWITECGWPWKRGPDRPPPDQDGGSALAITMKGIEARACGIARYFPFVYPFYEEEKNNFGMMDRRGTPLRSMAAYARLVGVLAGKEYVGDLECADKAVRRARVFADRDQAVVAVYTGKLAAAAVVELPVPVRAAEGIDGRRLPIAGGKLPVPDGLSYAWIGRKQLDRHLKTGTAAMRLGRMARPPPGGRPEPSPIVMRLELDPAVLEAKTEGYTVKQGNAYSRLPVRVRVFNLGRQPQELTVRLTLPAEASLVECRAEQPVRAPAQSSAEIAWRADLSSPLAATGAARLRITAEGEKAGRVAPRVVELAGELSLPKVLSRHADALRLSIGDLARWQPAITGGGRMTMERGAEATWSFHCRFAEGDRWVYPQFRLPEGLDLSRFSALVVRARCRPRAQVRVFLWEGDTGVGYLTPDSAIPADGGWHTAIIPFQDLRLSPANAPDPNGRLDLDQVRRISIGMNSQSAENTLDVSDAYLLRGRQ
jgi:hypothetical protein